MAGLTGYCPGSISGRNRTAKQPPPNLMVVEFGSLSSVPDGLAGFYPQLGEVMRAMLGRDCSGPKRKDK
ncbi:hypothetical protein SLEP1_g43977 [Rubroshorea leprosula]|uniref:Uncharacterized protein n=1 Tax=Rubroshorea leprosula TaxID=152421 RepID=A0AAV5LGJ0_9ROSI|nr:hypothetical protein SLEP1_g43977 [Rubroshorea leprosula]